MTQTDSFNAKLLRARGIHYYPILGSTNSEAHRLAKKGAAGGTVVLANAQSAGRGRQSRPWSSPPGKGLYFSLLLRPSGKIPAVAAPVTLAAAVSIARQLRQSTGLEVAVKWPNDLLIGIKKIGGILTEARTSDQVLLYIVLGIGLNINQQEADFPGELHLKATSLYLKSGLTYGRTALFFDLLESLRRSLDLFFKEGFAPFQPLWKEMSATLGKKVVLAGSDKHVQGIAVDLDASGALLVEDARGQRHRIFYGEII